MVEDIDRPLGQATRTAVSRAFARSRVRYEDVIFVPLNRHYRNPIFRSSEVISEFGQRPVPRLAGHRGGLIPPLRVAASTLRPPWSPHHGGRFSFRRSLRLYRVRFTISAPASPGRSVRRSVPTDSRSASWSLPSAAPRGRCPSRGGSDRPVPARSCDR